MPSDKLQRYRAKRDFHKTPEPGGGTARARPRAEPSFVIQKHDASSAALRLPPRGRRRRCARGRCPKGPSTDPREKRLAVEVEDHPLDYADFEGVIGEGTTAPGAVIVWDAGTYRNLDEERSMAEALDAGHAKVWLEGEKLHGGWTLAAHAAAASKPQWLLIKRRDEGADARRNPQSTQPESVKTGRTIEQVAREERRRRRRDGRR